VAATEIIGDDLFDDHARWSVILRYRTNSWQEAGANEHGEIGRVRIWRGVGRRGMVADLCRLAADCGTRHALGIDQQGHIMKRRAVMPKPPITGWAPARWALIRWPWSTISCEYAAWTGCASPTPRSCRP